MIRWEVEFIRKRGGTKWWKYDFIQQLKNKWTKWIWKCCICHRMGTSGRLVDVSTIVRSMLFSGVHRTSCRYLKFGQGYNITWTILTNSRLCQTIFNMVKISSFKDSSFWVYDKGSWNSMNVHASYQHPTVNIGGIDVGGSCSFQNKFLCQPSVWLQTGTFSLLEKCFQVALFQYIILPRW